MTAGRIRHLVASRYTRWAGLTVAVLVFAGGLVLSLRSVPDLPAGIKIGPLILLFLLGAPAAIAYSAVEFLMIGRIAGKDIGWRRALEVTVYVTATGMIFSPASYAAKIAAMRVNEIAVGRGTASMFAFIALGAGSSLIYSSVALLFCGARQAAVWIGLAGLILIAATAVTVFYMKVDWRIPAFLLALRLCFFVLTGFRYMLAIAAVGGHVGFAEGSVFVASQAANIVGTVIPANLGVTETIAASLSPLIGIPSNIGFLAAAVGRVVWMLGQAITALIVIAVVRRRGK